MASFSNQAEAS
jgi:hypothetical protein